MLKILVVEDEYLMRERLVKAIDWASIGCEIIGQAENGVEAVEVINREVPDIVLTDIKMPKMDGLELAQFIHNEYPFIKIIIMTGYSDFSYAKVALKAGVKDYILKPSDKEEILSSVANIVELIKKERKVFEDNEKKSKTVTENLTFLRAKIFDDIINGYTFNIEEQNKKLGDIIKKNNVYVIMSTEISSKKSLESVSNENLTHLFSELKFAIEKFCSKKSYDYIVSITNGLIYTILFYDNSYSSYHIAEATKSYARELREFVKDILDIDISIGISRCCVDISELGNVYREAEERLKKEAFISKDGVLVQVEENTGDEETVIKYPLNEINSLMDMVRNGDKDILEDSVEKLFHRLARSKGCNEEYIRSICDDIVLICSNTLREFDKKVEDLKKSDFNIYYSLSMLSSLPEFVEWTTDFLFSAMDIVVDNTKTMKKKSIVDILDYINSHYMEDISLTKTADFVHVHPVYLGRLLRKELGENFSDILLKVRIENAKKLLKDVNVKTYEVAYGVGINDPHYFSQVFKKYTGKTPTEFRETLGK